jgi:hypothetical protein
MKITKEQLKSHIRRLVQEQLDYKDIVPGADGGFVKYAQKVDDLLLKFMDDAEKLIQEGSDIMKADVLESAKVGERNRYILARVGVLRALKTSVSNAFERLKKEV